MKEADSDLGKSSVKGCEGIVSYVVVDNKQIESQGQDPHVPLSAFETSVYKHSNDFSTDEMQQRNPSLSSQPLNQSSDSKKNHISDDGQEQLTPATS